MRGDLGLIAAILAAVPTAAHAQACRQQGTLKVKYDRFTDSTIVETKADNRFMITMKVVASYPGERPGDSLPARFYYRERNPQFGTQSRITVDNAQYSAGSTLFLLMDGKDRMPLSGGTYRKFMDAGAIGLGIGLDEFLEYPLSSEQLRRLAAAKTAEVKIGSMQLRLADKVLVGVRDLVACQDEGK